MKRRNLSPHLAVGYTLIDAIASVAIIALVVALFVVTLSRNRKATIMLAGCQQLRGIHQSLVLSAQANNTYYPGLDTTGNDKNPAVADRFHHLIVNQYFMPYYIIHPADDVHIVWTAGPFTSSHYSFTLSSLTGNGARRAEWRQTNNRDAPVAADQFGGSPAYPTTFDSKHA